MVSYCVVKTEESFSVLCSDGKRDSDGIEYTWGAQGSEFESDQDQSKFAVHISCNFTSSFCKISLFFIFFVFVFLINFD